MVGRTRRLTCPKCRGVFDYEFVPGASFTAIRLGASRYLRCPRCGRFSRFSLRDRPTAPPPEGSLTGTVPRFSDVRSVGRGVALLVVPFLVFVLLIVFLLPRPEPALLVAIAGGAGFVALVVYGIYRGKLRPGPVA